MAEAQVSITYRSVPARVVYYALLVALPAAAVFLLWFAVVVGLAVSAGKIASGPSMFLLTCQVLLMMLTMVALVAFADRTIFISRTGIAVPVWLSPGLKLRSELPWSELIGVKVLLREKEDRLVLFFERGRRVPINLRDLSEDSRQQLLLALEVWTAGSDQFPDLETLRMRTGMAGQLLSYTKMWEDELARRFGATNFVPLEPGRTLRNGELQVIRQLAFGGLSAIYLVHSDGQRFVLKESVVPADSDQELQKKASEQFQREAQLLSAIDHPNIVKVRDHFVEDGRDYLLLDHVAGSDLRRLIKEKGARSIDEVNRWAVDIANILQYLHGRNPPIIHRDLTPDNLVLSNDDSISAIDFGAANEFLGTATGTMIGKQCYIAPEQLRGRANRKSDIYSFGCTLYFLLTATDPEPLSVSRPIEKNPDVPGWLNDLVASCTEMEPEKRPDIDDVCNALARRQIDFPLHCTS